MTRFLASIATVHELPPVLKGGADLIDAACIRRSGEHSENA